ncbi:hypothetical protein K491DRAFT_721946 [Lophiostoma macrostomum CBS 122681]|uniref:RING-type domain-containing protein n=1 Tax=Lophiostoma macrostomum CBS 122681 TaxID=1314788 RepID=A0A6A6SRD1_9PLEO|nr:hypothetical protein K491DRAFT_721946 [Lophiostoma macrostomum CBS 122681]
MSEKTVAQPWAKLAETLQELDTVSVFVTDDKRPNTLRTSVLTKLDVSETARLRYRAQPVFARDPLQDKSFLYLATDATKAGIVTIQFYDTLTERITEAQSDQAEVNFLTSLDAMACIPRHNWTHAMRFDAQLFADLLDATRRNNKKVTGERPEDFLLYTFVKRLRFYVERRKGSSWARMTAALSRTKDAVGMVDDSDVEATINRHIMREQHRKARYETKIEALEAMEGMPLEEFCKPLVVPFAVELDVNFSDSGSELTDVSNVTEYVEGWYADTKAASVVAELDLDLDDSDSDLTEVSQVTEYVEARYADGSFTKSKAQDDTFDCGICRNAVKTTDGVKINECKHIYCRDCLQAWVGTTDQLNSNSCPHCRGKMFSKSRYPAKRLKRAKQALKDTEDDLQVYWRARGSLQWLQKELELHERYVSETASSDEDLEGGSNGTDNSEIWSSSSTLVDSDASSESLVSDEESLGSEHTSHGSSDVEAMEE